jgi:hypothetical protein
MAHGGYVVYLARDELSPSWFARTNLDPGMDAPEDPNNAFQLYKAYGHTIYQPLILDAVKSVLYNAGYNREGTMIAGDKPGSYYDQMRIGTQVNARTRIKQLWREIRNEAAQRCLEKIANGETVTITNSRENDEIVTITEGNDCTRVKKKLSAGGFRPVDLNKAGLVGRDLIKTLGLMIAPETYRDGGNERPWKISDQEIEEIRKKVSVYRVGDLTVVGRGLIDP